MPFAVTRPEDGQTPPTPLANPAEVRQQQLSNPLAGLIGNKMPNAG